MANQTITIVEGTQTAMPAVGLGAVYDPAIDTGHGIDLFALGVALGLADSGAGAEAVAHAVLKMLADSGLGVDSARLVATLAMGDVARGVDDTTLLAMLLQLHDSGAGIDAILDVLVFHVYIRADGTVEPFGVILLQGGNQDLLPTQQEHTEQVPGYSGQLDFGPDFGPRSLELRVASGNLTPAQKSALKRYVASWLSPTAGVFSIAWEDDPDRYLDVRMSGAVQPQEFADYLEFAIPLKANAPWYLGSQLRTLTGSGTATSDGNVPTPATVTIQGPVTNPSVTIAGAACTWTGAVTSSDRLVIDGGRQTVTFNGVNALSSFSGAFPELQPGDNTVTAAAGGTTTVTWRARWI